MTTLEYILDKYKIGKDAKYPVVLNIKRYDLAGLFNELGFEIGAEIGVDKGEYSETMCLRNPSLKLYSIDPWDGVYSKSFPEAKKRLAKHNCEIIRKASMEAVKDFTPSSLDFVYIDGDHSYEHVLEDITGWSKIVRPGGIVSGHDYLRVRFKHRRMGVRKAVDQYLSSHNIKEFFMVHRNAQSSWFFVK